MTANRKYTTRFTLAMIGYIVALVASLTILQSMELPGAAKIVVAVLPVVPILFGFYAFMDHIRSMDELQRKIQFEGFAFSLGMTGIITFTVGFLENAGVPTFSLIWVLPISIAMWALGSAIAAKRYE
jgi:hypothetical protein